MLLMIHECDFYRLCLSYSSRHAMCVHLCMLELIVGKGRQVYELLSEYLALQPLRVNGVLQSSSLVNCCS